MHCCALTILYFNDHDGLNYDMLTFFVCVGKIKAFVSEKSLSRPSLESTEHSATRDFKIGLLPQTIRRSSFMEMCLWMVELVLNSKKLIKKASGKDWPPGTFP